MNGPDGRVSHTEIKIGDSIIMIAEENPQNELRSPQTLNGSTVSIFLYLDHVDPIFNKALSAGAKQIMPLADQFWGDRYALVEDPYGYKWSLAAHVREMSPEEIRRAQDEAMAQMSAMKKTA